MGIHHTALHHATHGCSTRKQTTRTNVITDMAEHNIIGQKGEEIAAEVMRKKGFRVVDTNWKFGHLEMDVIAVNRKEIAFVEVKTRTTSFGGKGPRSM